ncbi:MAG: hypothetical protein WBD99_14205, partial [Thermodesulfobacteriota bacterium]
MFKLAGLCVIISCTVLIALNFLLTSAKTDDHTETRTNPESIFTPVLMSVIANPDPVKGSDGKFHIVYELKVTNATSINWEIKSIEVRDGRNEKRTLTSYSGDDVKTKMQLLGDKTSTNA